jgi:hypothetical protein
LKEAGGKALVQFPGEARFKNMPLSAITFDGPLDRIAPIAELAQEICRLVQSNARGHGRTVPASESANP